MVNPWNSRKLAIVALLSSLGGLASLLVGYAGNFLSFVPLGSFVTGQLLSGLHVFWLILAVSIVKRRGAATFSGALKGVVEMLLPNHLGPFVFVLSFVEGLALELVLAPFKKISPLALLLAAGISSATNVLILQLFVIPNLAASVLLGMYVASFCSGVVFAGYLGHKTLRGIRPFLRSELQEDSVKEK